MREQERLGSGETCACMRLTGNGSTCLAYWWISSSGSRRPSRPCGARRGDPPGISEEGRGSGQSPEVFRSCDSQAWPAGPARPAWRGRLDVYADLFEDDLDQVAEIAVVGRPRAGQGSVLILR